MIEKQVQVVYNDCEVINMKPAQENQELRDYAKKRGVALWQIANEFDVHAMTLISRLRKPFTDEQAAAFKRIVDGLSGGVSNG